MVTVYGMSDNIGPISLKREEPYDMQPFGEKLEDEVGREVKQMIEDAYMKAQQILLANMDKLHAVAGKLLEKEVISSEEFEMFFNM